jgi:hypothetical protein
MTRPKTIRMTAGTSLDAGGFGRVLTGGDVILTITHGDLLRISCGFHTRPNIRCKARSRPGVSVDDLNAALPREGFPQRG